MVPLLVLHHGLTQRDAEARRQLVLLIVPGLPGKGRERLYEAAKKMLLGADRVAPGGRMDSEGEGDICWGMASV